MADHKSKVESSSPDVKNQHTPGPWEVYGATEICVFGDNWAHIAVVSSPRGPEGKDDPARSKAQPVWLSDPRFKEACANARLIAAAPDLLAALRSLHKWCDDNINGSPLEYGKIMVAADAAIAKAEGRQ